MPSVSLFSSGGGGSGGGSGEIPTLNTVLARGNQSERTIRAGKATEPDEMPTLGQVAEYISELHTEVAQNMQELQTGITEDMQELQTGIETADNELLGKIDHEKSRIDAILGRVTNLNAYDFGTSDPADLQTLLTVYAQTQLQTEDIPNATSVRNLFDDNQWIYNELQDAWINFGPATLKTAEEDKLGVVKGSAAELKIAVEESGEMHVNGLEETLDGKQNTITETGTDRALTAPETPGGQPGSVPLSDLYGREFALAPDWTEITQLGTFTFPSTGTASSDWASNILTVPQNGFILVQGRIQTNYAATFTTNGIKINGVWVSRLMHVPDDMISDYYYGPAPVSAGDKIQIDFWTTRSSINWTHQGARCNFIKPKVVAMQTAPTPANRLLTMGPPDYSTITVVADIQPVVNSSLIWTADTDCYIDAISTATGAAGSIYIKVEVPGKPVVELFMAGKMTEGQRNLYQMKIVAGTKIYTGGDAATRMSRIILHSYAPMINPPLHVDGQPLINYSTEEQNTGTKWIDGRTVYQCTASGTVNLAAGTNTALATFTGISLLIDGFGLVSRSTNSHVTIPCRSVDASEAAGHLVADITQTASGSAVATVRCDTAITGAFYAVTIKYVK